MQRILINRVSNVCQDLQNPRPTVRQVAKKFAKRFSIPKGMTKTGDYFVRSFPRPETIPLSVHDIFVDSRGSFSESVREEIKSLISSNLKGNKEIDTKKLEEVLFNEGKSIEKIRELINSINFFKTEITDPVIKAAIVKRNGVRSYRSLDKLISLVELDSALYNRSYSLKGDNFKTVSYLIKNGNEGIINEIELAQCSNLLPFSEEAKLLKNEMELDSLKTYLMNNCYEDPLEFQKYLYEQYYLSRLSPGTRTMCKKISDEFDTKVFLEDESNPEPANIIYNELSEWERASQAHKKSFLSPPVINLSRWNSFYYIEDKNAKGYCGTNYCLFIKEKLAKILRHEMLHLNYSYKREADVINGIDIGTIIVRGPKKPNGEPGDLIWKECKYKDEFFNAGLSLEDIFYGHTDILEFKANAALGDYSKFSPEFKELLVNIGVPEYVFDMKPNSDSVRIANFIAELKNNNPELKTMGNVLKYINQNPKVKEELFKLYALIKPEKLVA